MDDKQVVDKNLNERALLKKCPKCGKRFDVEHTTESVEKKKELVPEQTVSLPETMIAGVTPITVTNAPSSQRRMFQHETLREEDDYMESYVCKRCGYTWTEMFEKTRDVGSASGLGPDL